MNKTEESYERSFCTLLEDSLELVAIAGIIDPDRIARGSAISSLLLIEAAANCCIDSLGFDAKPAEEMDRLQTIAKFEIYLRLRHRKKLDRSKHPYAIFRELRNLRDAVAHPKHLRVLWEFEDETTATSETPKTTVLSVATSMQRWRLHDSIQIIRGTHDFLRFFFIDQCRLKPRAVTALLCSEARIPNSKGDYMFPALSANAITFCEKNSIDLSYMKWGR